MILKNRFNDVFRNKMINKSVFENPVSKQSLIYKNWNVWSLDRSVQKSYIILCLYIYIVGK